MWIDDEILANCREPISLSVFIPDSTMIVCGASNNAETEVDTSAAYLDKVPVLKRYGGGGTVVLYPGCVVVSLGCWVSQPYQNSSYFKSLNDSLIHTLSFVDESFSSLTQAGISDIAFGMKKVVGTSLFRSRNYLLFQASIIVDLQIELIKKYLKHPSREPEYRKGRSHEDFICGLSDISSVASVTSVKQCLDQNFKNSLTVSLGHDLITPVIEHIPHLMKRVQTPC